VTLLRLQQRNKGRWKHCLQNLYRMALGIYYFTLHKKVS